MSQPAQSEATVWPISADGLVRHHIDHRAKRASSAALTTPLRHWGHTTIKGICRTCATTPRIVHQDDDAGDGREASLASYERV